MAIRFACPWCQQPIEIDDPWAGQAVGCPYCKRVVSAPASSNWPPGEIPVAHPAGSAFQPPPPPSGQLPPAIRAGYPGSRAAWALTLAVTCVVLSLLGWLIWLGALTAAVHERVGANATKQQVKEAMQDILVGGQLPRNPLVMAIGLVGMLCGMGGLAVSIRALLRQEPRRGMAIAACVISACLTCCLGMLTLMSIGVRG